MPTQISQDNIQPATLAILGGGLTVTNIQITNSGYTVIDDTAVLLAGGYIKITGTNFASGCQVVLGSVNATSVTFVNSTTLNVQVPAQAAGTYVVYVVNPDGGVAIRVNGLTYSGNPTWVTGSTLPDQPANTAISIQLVATGDAPLTYIVQTGSTLPSGVALSSGGLITGSVAVGVQTLYNFTIEAIDAESQESPRAFTVTITVGDTYWDYVTTLISANTPTTSVFVDDASTNNFPVSIFGDTKPNNFGPYTAGYYSNYFDGTGDYLTVPNNINLTIGSGDFTIECWVYITGAQTTTYGWSVAGPSTNQGSSGWGLVVNRSFDTRGFGFICQNGFVSNDSTYLPVGQWVHLAVTRSGSGANNLKLFKNGVISSQTTYTTTDTYTASPVYIGADGQAGQGFPGYISNFRFVSGTALYTANFTPSTTPLTAVANTSLLTCQSNRFIDNSTNNFALTVNGNLTVSGFDPFLPDTSYSTYGSTYFDGTSSYLSLPDNSGTTASGVFSVETYVYSSVTGTNRVIYGQYTSAVTSGRWYLRINTDNTLSWLTSSGSNITTSATVSTSVWQHVCLTRDASNVFRIFLNGVLVGTATNAVALDTGGCKIGIYVGVANYFNGYMSNFRIVSTAIPTDYQTSSTTVGAVIFTPPTSPLTAISGTSLLTCQTNQPVNNNVFIDNSTNNLFITRNGNATQGTFSPYGENWSNYFDGTGDYLVTATSSALSLATNAADFTIECWLYNNGYAGSQYGRGICIYYLSGSYATNRLMFRLIAGANRLNIYLIASNTIQFGNSGIDGNATIPTNAWTHVALVRNAGVFYVYVNGVLDITANSSSASSSIPFSTYNIIEVGRTQDGTSPDFYGYISNYRFVKGTAVYTTNFTPSTTPLQPIAGTSLLTCAGNGFVDDSANNFTITRTGDVSVQKFGPFAGTTLPTPYYSGYFDGSGDSLTLPSNQTQFTMGTGDFTVEMWVYVTSLAATRTLYDTMNSGDSTGTGRFAIQITTGGTIQIFTTAGTVLTSGGTVTIESWNHIAYSRNSNSGKLYLNGVQVNSTYTDNNNYVVGTTSRPMIGANGFNGTSNPMLGYISNLRVVKGTGLYTAGFTPSTTPLTAISGTSLLTCQNNTFIDNSTNNFAVTAVGNTIPSTFAPFTVTYSVSQSYTPAVFGGSMYFDGIGDFITVGSTAVTLPTATTPFTMEAWVYITAFTGISIISTNYVSGAIPFMLGLTNGTANSTSAAGGYPVMYYYTGSAWNYLVQSNATNSTQLSLNTWYHIAGVYTGSAATIYVNGKATVTAAQSTWPTTASAAGGINVGRKWDTSAAAYFSGYISNARLVIGTALYTSNFVPQNIPLTPVQNTVLMVNGTSAGAYDSSMMNNYETVGDAKIDTTVVKFTGTESVRFDGNGDSLTYIGGPSINFGTGDFTIELWVNMANTGTFSSFLRPDDAGSVASIGYDWSNNQLKFDARNAVILNVTTTAVVANTWTHIAVTRSGTSLILFVNGTQVGSTTNSTNFASATGLIYIGGSSFSAAHSVNGYISDFRITRGVARYTTTFTPPTSPFPTN